MEFQTLDLTNTAMTYARSSIRYTLLEDFEAGL